jgi:hypothetical protein
MRHSNQSSRGSRRPWPAVGRLARGAVVIVAVTIAGCGPSAVASGSPTPLPTPVITPDPHLTAPVTADQIYLAIAAGHMTMFPNNATSGGANQDIVKRINADLNNWPLRITAFQSAAALHKAHDWKPGSTPVRGEAPYNFVALNVLVEYGPTNTAATPTLPEPSHQADAATLVGLLDPLLWPIEQHSVATIPARTPIPPVGASPAPSGKPRPSPSKAPPSKAP